ncbi:MAG: MtN3 and saliva related transrane protein [Candidatus Parcubacteria bacterium]|jgi:uncharacterized protein with PQ loop repeat|nr:MtN3 and saliva related transrane protein [Candidatus Parcubacteria bacterium]
MQDVLHHRLKRKHGTPAASGIRGKWIRFIDVFVYPIGFLGIAAAMPQIAQIWVYHNADGVSVLSWTMWGFFSIVWVFYGIAHKARVMVILNSIWVVLNLGIALGAYLYG